MEVSSPTALFLEDPEEALAQTILLRGVGGKVFLLEFFIKSAFCGLGSTRFLQGEAEDLSRATVDDRNGDAPSIFRRAGDVGRPRQTVEDATP